MPDFDLIVIGSGPAGEKGAVQAAYFGKRVALVERSDVLGGAGCNTGTLPSKALRESAILLSGLAAREVSGLKVHRGLDIRVEELMGRKEKVVAYERERIARNLARHSVQVLHGAGRLVDPHTVEVAGPTSARRHTAEIVLLAPGSHPARPKDIPFDLPGVYDSDGILGIGRVPRSLCVLGGGVIGCEYASLFAALDVEVHLVEGKERLLGFVDAEIGELLSAGLRRRGVDLVLGERVAAIAATHEGLEVGLRSGRRVACEALLVAAGRLGNTDGLGLDAAGVRMDERGRVRVDDAYRTSVPSIYAVGDVIGFPALASTSMEQGRVAVCHAFGFTYKQKVDSQLPYGLYTIPEVSMVGRTEEDCQKAGIPYETGRALYRDNARGQIIGELDGMVKLVFHRETRKLLGAHILGERATELVHVAQACMHFDGTLDYFIQSVFNYPTLTEAYKYAAYDGLGRLARATSQAAPSSLH